MAAFWYSAQRNAAVMFVGAFPEINPAPSISIPVDTFPVPVEISGAVNLQNWQFDLVYDNTLVEVVDPFDGSSGIYGAEFTPGDANTLSFILGGFPLPGLVDDLGGSYRLSSTGRRAMVFWHTSCSSSSKDKKTRTRLSA